MTIKGLKAIVISLVVVCLPLHAQIGPEKKISSLDVSQQEVKKSSLINLNTAGIDVLSSSVKGIGRKRAEAIIKYREAHGGFKQVSELQNVRGLGKNFVNAHLQELQQTFTVE